MRPTLLTLCVILLAPFAGFAQDDGSGLGLPQIRERIDDETVSAGERASLVGLLFSHGVEGEVALRVLLGRNGLGADAVSRWASFRTS